MLGRIVDYLHGARVSFRLASYASEELRPIAAHPLPRGGILVDARPYVVGGRPVIAVFPADEVVDPAAISASLGAVALSGTNDDLPGDLGRAVGPIPPLGQLFGIPILLDARVEGASVIVFRVFDESVYFEIAYDDWALLEQPRVASFSAAGELGVGASPWR